MAGEIVPVAEVFGLAEFSPEAIRAALAEIHRPEEIKRLDDAASALRRFYETKVEKGQAAIANLLIRQRGGELLANDPNITQGGDRKSEKSNSTRSSLIDLGISWDMSSEWQKLYQQGDKVDAYIAQFDFTDPDADPDALPTIRGALNYGTTPAPVEKVPPLPDTFSTLVIDPPWPMPKIERKVRPNQTVHLDYPTLTLEQIADEDIVPVRHVAAADAHLYLWVTHKYLPAGLELVEQWGFKYQCLMTWRKNVGITPFSWMYDTEHVIFARRGSLPLEQLGLRLSFEADAQGHSIKPDVFYERVALASPAPRVDLFPGAPHEGFEPWGLEASHR